jgi:hypothetical protein
MTVATVSTVAYDSQQAPLDHQEFAMPTLHIEHPISDFDTWSAAYARFAQRRRRAGVVHERVSRPVDDPRYVMVGLDFDTLERAESFLRFLQTQIWAVPEQAPALAGTPRTRILDVVEDR